MTLHGGAGRLLTFSRAGHEVVDYSHATALRGTLGRVPVSLQGHGQISYQVQSTGSILRFSDGSFTKYRVTVSYGSSELHSGPPGDSPPVRFTCSGSRQTQIGSYGYSAVFVRVH